MRNIPFGTQFRGAAFVIVAEQDKKVRRLLLWAAPNDLRVTFRYVMGTADYARLDVGKSL